MLLKYLDVSKVIRMLTFIVTKPEIHYAAASSHVAIILHYYVNNNT